MKKTQKSKKSLNSKLYVRILPSTDFCYDSIKLETDKKALFVRCLQDLKKGVKPKALNYWCFRIDGVFWNVSQNEVYETVTSDLFNEIFNGVGALVLCYGQTGSGKTFTTSGLRFQFENRGLLLRILSQLFEEANQRQNTTKTHFGMSYLEFMGENVKDLINEKLVDNIQDVAEHQIVSEEWAWKKIFDAEFKKSYTESASYAGSNRGHSVLTFYIHSESLIDTNPVATHSKIHIVDMGGIDNLGNEPSASKNKSDLGNSNLSKCLMEQLILCLIGAAWKNKNHICSYKSSRFLIYLHDTLQPKCLIRFIAHIHGNSANLPLTISSLKFGEKIKCFKPTKLEKVMETSYALQVKNLEREFLQLREEMELSGMLRDYPDSCNMSQERLNEIRRAAEKFLQGQLGNLTLLSLGQANLTFEVFRSFHQKLSLEKDQVAKNAIAVATEMLQMQLASERNSNPTLPILPITQKMSRRKSRQQESQISFGVSYRSSDSAQVIIGRSSSAAQQVGITDKKGIGIGPGKTNSVFEGNITKLFKKLKSKKSDSVIIKGMKSVTTKDFGTTVSKTQNSDEIPDLPINQSIPSREEAVQCFLNEKFELAMKLKIQMETYEENATAAKQKYTVTLNEFVKLKKDIKECREELENCQMIRLLNDAENFKENENFSSKDTEKTWLEYLKQKEKQLENLMEKCHVALTDYRNAMEELNIGKKVEEETFQDFCKEHYKIAFPPEEFLKVDMKSERLGKHIFSERDLRNQARMELYNQLHEKLLNQIAKRPKRK